MSRLSIICLIRDNVYRSLIIIVNQDTAASPNVKIHPVVDLDSTLLQVASLYPSITAEYPL